MSKLHTDSYIFALWQNDDQKLIIINKKRTQILTEKFFFMFIATNCLKNIYKLSTVSELIFDGYIFVEKVLKTINRLLSRKIAGSDRILNEILKRITSVISMDFIQEIYTTFICGLLLTYYRELIIIILHKKNKKNYLLLRSFRLIILKNMLIKIVKKMLVTCLSCIAEEYSLLFWIQMRIKRDRSIISALNLLILCIQTAWYVKPGSIVLILSLNLSETFNNVLYNKLLDILYQKGLSEWLVQSVKYFLSTRYIYIAYTEYKSNWIKINTDISQSSFLSLIFFLFFISGLLK